MNLEQLETAAKHESMAALVAKLYACRKSSRFVLGDSFSEVMKQLGEALKKRGESPIASALAVIREHGLDGIEAVHVLAAAVELIEPTPPASEPKQEG